MTVRVRASAGTSWSHSALVPAIPWISRTTGPLPTRRNATRWPCSSIVCIASSVNGRLLHVLGRGDHLLPAHAGRGGELVERRREIAGHLVEVVHRVEVADEPEVQPAV